MPKFTKGPWMSKRHDGAGRIMEFKREFWEVGGGPDKAGVAFVFKGQSNANLITAAPEMYTKLDKIATWLERNAARLEEYAENCRDFQSIADTERANAKNYRNTAADIRKLLKKVDAHA
jgi:hypothetical protein